MSGIDYLADTNALIYLLGGNPCMTDFLHSNLAVSVISELELLSFSNIGADEETTIRQLLASCLEVGISEDIKELVIATRRKYKVRLPDAIVAASAMSCNLPLLTADRGFCKIKELNLKLIDPVFLGFKTSHLG